MNTEHLCPAKVPRAVSGTYLTRGTLVRVKPECVRTRDKQHPALGYVGTVMHKRFDGYLIQFPTGRFIFPPGVLERLSS